MHGIRYSWFVNIERPFRGGPASPTPITCASCGSSSIRFPTRSNPDQLPVGFGRRYDDTLQDWVADITCSACHTGQLHVKRPGGRVTALRVDGGQSMNAFTDIAPGSFQVELAGAFATHAGQPDQVQSVCPAGARARVELVGEGDAVGRRALDVP